ALPSLFAVDGGLVDGDRDRFTGGSGSDLAAVADKGGDDALGGFGFVAEELGRADAVADREPDGLGRGLAGAGPIGAGLGLLALHGGGEAIGIDGDAALAQRVLGQVERKAVG